MRNESPLAVISRRKWIIAATFLAFVATAAVISKSLTKVYATQATLVVTLAADSQSFDTVQASQAIARSYADIIRNPNIAARVATTLGGGTRKKDVLDATDFEVIPETQLLKIHSEDKDPAQAKRIADTYADTFIAFSRAALERTTKAAVTRAGLAPLPASPVRPKPTLYTLVAALLGAGLGLALAFLRDRLDRRIRTSEEAEAAFDEPILTRVPRRGRSDTSRFAFQEAFRILRTNLRFLTRAGGEPRAVAITSWSAGEGKTTTAANLARAAAETGARVLVVEADFRRPALQREVASSATEPLRPGFSNYLVDAATLEEVIHDTDMPGVQIVPAGPLPPSPSGLLEAGRAHDAIENFKSRADIVIFDCPPLSVGAEAAVICSWMEVVLLMVDLSGSTDRGVREAIRRLDAVNARLSGLVLNRDRSLEPSAYDYYNAGSKKRQAETPAARS